MPQLGVATYLSILSLRAVGLNHARANKFKDGIIARVGNTTNSLVRTALQHASAQAREATWQENSSVIESVIWTATLDGRTSMLCKSLDGREFPIDKGIRPPAHINCRSTIRAKLKPKYASLQKGATRFSRGTDGVKYVPAGENYYGWLKNQPKAFQESAIGVKRTQLLRNGGLSSEKFSKLNLNKNFSFMLIMMFFRCNITGLPFSKKH